MPKGPLEETQTLMSEINTHTHTHTWHQNRSFIDRYCKTWRSVISFAIEAAATSTEVEADLGIEDTDAEGKGTAETSNVLISRSYSMAASRDEFYTGP